MIRLCGERERAIYITGVSYAGGLYSCLLINIGAGGPFALGFLAANIQRTYFGIEILMDAE